MQRCTRLLPPMTANSSFRELMRRQRRDRLTARAGRPQFFTRFQISATRHPAGPLQQGCSATANATNPASQASGKMIESNRVCHPKPYCVRQTSGARSSMDMIHYGMCSSRRERISCVMQHIPICRDDVTSQVGSRKDRWNNGPYIAHTGQPLAPENSKAPSRVLGAME
jgi:hypothetical protein